ncbi:MAG: class I SAM-dependent methyltransferase [Verrucomicrobiota bacterium]|nr:class I SAM-dependent methyltransferase [Verrucomicrobiota bacterium]
MIIHKLISQHLKAADDPTFYTFQADDAISWLEKKGVTLGKGVAVLDLGCGHGIFGGQLKKKGCEVTFSDEQNFLEPSLRNEPFIQFNLETDSFVKLGSYDLVICSNVLEHLRMPSRLYDGIPQTLNPGGVFYLSWTNWLSPWGGHEFSPFHFLGAQTGVKLYDLLIGKKRLHTPYQNLFPTFIGKTLRDLTNIPNIQVKAVEPRYYPELKLIMKLPGIREFLAWNTAIMMEKN